MTKYRWEVKSCPAVWGKYFIAKEVFIDFWNNLNPDIFRLSETGYGYDIYLIKGNLELRAWKLFLMRPVTGGKGFVLQIEIHNDVENEFIDSADESCLVSICEQFLRKVSTIKQIEPSLVWNLA